MHNILLGTENQRLFRTGLIQRRETRNPWSIIKVIRATAWSWQKKQVRIKTSAITAT